MRLAILGSGKGSNARSILSKFEKGQLANLSEISLFSDHAESPFLRLAEEFNCEGQFLNSDNKTNKIKGIWEDNFIEKIQRSEPDLVVLAGFMKILGEKFINHFNRNVINIHPSLLPSFKGLEAIKRAYNFGVKVTGCTVHWVTPSVDEGNIIDQVPVRIMPSDTIDSLTRKVHEAEHYLLPKVIQELELK